VSSGAPADEPSPAPAGRRGRLWLARAVALVALVGSAVAIYAAVKSVHGSSGATVAQARATMQRMAAANATLSSQLQALVPGASPLQVQQTNRTTAGLAGELSASANSGGSIGAAVHAALTAELAYTDAVGSSLSNPRSVLLAKVPALATALRAALQAVPGGSPQTVSGDTALVTYSQSRAAG
jgi:hypothetical protein